MSAGVSLLANRYELHAQLGAGGMGAVYRATDRLNSQSVAIKRVIVSPQQLDFASRPRQNAADDPAGDSESFRLSLALEFRTLAGLRHPNIVSVLDYGFDETGQPFFVMQLVEDARSLLDFAAEKDASEKLNLVIRLLQALAYLHRRGIIHRDLKPQNVLVDGNGVLKVLDFGLALHQRDSITNVYETGVGTIAYMAPELLMDEPASVQSDLYSVGLLLCELLTGSFPYNRKNLGVLMQEILNVLPALDRLDGPLADFVVRLLAKRSNERYESAEVALAELCAAAGKPLPAEDALLRESYLQAAQFVGRESELTQLLEAFEHAQAGRGSGWLVGGESGVGKSRLLEELRIRALVQGVIVLRGQAVEGAGLPYQLWRDAVRRLLLAVPVNAMEAGVLKEIVPDIATLLDRDVPDAPALEGDAAQQRLSVTILALLKRHAQPTLLLLEDLQWAQDSLQVLTALQNQLGTSRLLVIATFRHEEVPDLPEKFDAMRHITLRRLDKHSIAALCEAMLGTTGKNPQIVDLLTRETEGNTFFIVEVVRALAEDAGRLDAIGSITLPQTILTGSVMQIVQRRLSRLPDIIVDWLKRVAIVGRQLDMAITDQLLIAFATSDLLHQTLGTTEIDSPSRILIPGIAKSMRLELLTMCTNAAVLEADGEGWRFAHDKIRETLIASISESERPRFHRHVAEAIEAAYPDNASYAMMLSGHWRLAGEPQKEAHFALMAAREVLRVGGNLQAETLLSRALTLYADMDPSAHESQRLDVLVLLGDTLRRIGNVEAAAPLLNQAIVLAGALGEQQTEAKARLYLAIASSYLDDYEGIALSKQAVDYARKVEAEAVLADALAWCAVFQVLRTAATPPELSAATAMATEGLQLSRRLGLTTATIRNLYTLGVIADIKADFSASEQYMLQGITLARQIGDKQELGIGLGNLANLYTQQSDLDKARELLHESLHNATEAGHAESICLACTNLAGLEIELGNRDSARDYVRTAFMSMGNSSRLGTAVLSAAVNWTIHYGHPEDAGRWLGTLLADSTGNIAAFGFELLDNLKGEYPDIPIDRVLESGKTLTLQAVLDEVRARFTTAE